jgi:hypothetical protein
MSREPREYYGGRLREQVRELAAEVDALETRLEEGGWEPLSDYDQIVSDLRVRLREAGGRVGELEAASNASWPGLVKEAEEYLRNIANAVKTMTATLDDLLPE